MKKNYEVYSRYQTKPMNYKVKVKDFYGIYTEAKNLYGESFEIAYNEKLSQLKTGFASGELTILDANFELVDFVIGYIPSEPTVVYGLMPPYYPHVSNKLFENPDPKITALNNLINEFTVANFGEKYNKVNFFPGISDLSYTNVINADETKKALQDAMPLFETLYDVPIEDIKEIAMPCVNIGPWGKDLHKLTERVYKVDLLNRTPRLIDYVLQNILG